MCGGDWTIYEPGFWTTGIRIGRFRPYSVRGQLRCVRKRRKRSYQRDHKRYRPGEICPSLVKPEANQFRLKTAKDALAIRQNRSRRSGTTTRRDARHRLPC